MATDIWHYPRRELAQQVLNLFESGLSSALVFFAPRRMGKTEFLRKDVTPLAERKKWQVFYFSFLDVGDYPILEFTKALANFSKESGVLSKALKLFQRISTMSGEAWGVKAEIKLRESPELKESMKEIMKRLSQQGRVLLLMDEVQVLAENKENAKFIAALRTILDMNKDSLKVIFTGSSQEGLRMMFSQAKAPFFHFGLNLPFPNFDQEFTNHLSNVYETITKQKLDSEALWLAFQQMGHVPLLARGLVERIVLNPNWDIQQAQNAVLSELAIERDFEKHWRTCSALERLLLKQISKKESSLFSIEHRKWLAKELGATEIPVSSVQSALRVLKRKGLITQNPDHKNYLIEDPNFKNWLLEQS